MLKLYTAAGACSTACHIALQEAGIPFESKVVDFESGFFESKDFLNVNAKGYVPFLEIGQGKTLTEGTAIMQYIADQAPEKNLMPVKGYERAKAQEWLNFVATEIHKPLSSLFMAETLVPDATARAHFVNTVITTLKTRFEIVNNALEGKTFVMGDTYSVADGYLFTVMSWNKHLNIDLSAYKNIVNFQNRIYERPATQRAFKAEGLLN
jgi:glutathione S-transferase